MNGKFLWNIAESKFDEREIENIIKIYPLPRAVALYLSARNINTKEKIEEYLKPRISLLTDPYILPGVKKAAERIWQAILKKEKILVFGDYDTDGVTATALIYEILRAHGGIASFFLPHRFDDGYGMTVDSLKKALEENDVALIITVDCGISAVDAVSYAMEKKIDVIISDHHEPSPKIPSAFSVINPKLHINCRDLHILAGVGVAFKLAHGFMKYGRENLLCSDEYNLKRDLDLVALGTVADLVPLTGENRIMVSIGLKILSEQLRPGINALCQVANIYDEVKASDITYSLSPRINAAGRLDKANIALNMLIERDRYKAGQYALEINQLNLKRQETEAIISHEAQAGICNLQDRSTIVVFGEGCNLGVIGIVASKFAREYNRPTIIFSIDKERNLAYGSARSVNDINILEILSESSQFLERFGGHAMAAGLTVKNSDLANFIDSFEQSTKKKLSPDSIIPQINIDGIVSLAELNDSFFSYLPKLEPFGYGNSNPLFRINRLHVKNISPAGQNHSRGVLADDFDREIQFIAFNKTIDEFKISEYIDVAAIPQINNFRNNTYYQLQILDLKSS
ncbi:MAG TPA: single-stranded-DNA-specific exonuclease RecJ [Victivallales bacterium]|nr:single-stranded-DNA-specific exonuclease RecJ [Victivallales bacterium]